MFKNLHIQYFRCFEDIKLENFGNVNLIVGKNNVGKTTLLEALKVRCSGTGAIWELKDILITRQEIEREKTTDNNETILWNIRRLFYDDIKTRDIFRRSFSIGQIGENRNALTIELGWMQLIYDVTRGENIRKIVENVENVENSQDLRESIIIKFGDEKLRSYAFDKIYSSEFSQIKKNTKVDPELGFINYNYIPAYGFGKNEISNLWNRITLTDLENDIVEALKIISPQIERVSLIDIQRGGERVALMRKTGQQNPEPLKSMGDGMNRIFEMTLGLVNSKNGIFLIDEIENGVHYSVQSKLWSFIFQIAARMQIQVFATTHSWDCIEAFQKAASAHPAQGALIRLYDQEGKISAHTFDEHQLEILTRESIEVR